MILGTMIRRMLGKGVDRGEATLAELRKAQSALDEGRSEVAAAAISHALTLEPSRPGAYVLRAELARRQRRFPAAIADLRRAIALDPEAVDIHIDLSTVLHRMGRFEEALETLDHVLRLAPAHALAQLGRGLMLKELGLLAQSQRALARAVELDPRSVDARCHLAAVMHDAGDYVQADTLLAEVLAEDPECVEAHWVKAMHKLAEGEFGQGWPHYAFRLKRSDASIRPRALPWWDGSSDLAGRVLVLAEQGLGDEIMFASCFGELLSQTPDCVLECDARLGALFERSFPQARILAARNPHDPAPPVPEGVVAQVAAGSLPGRYRTGVRDFPAHRGYLHADPGRTRYWRERLEALGSGMKVGVSWIGGGIKTRRAMRSLALRELAPLLRVPGTRFVSLQYTDGTAEIAQLAQSDGLQLHHWQDAIDNYDETAALVAALDLVISVTTSLVHLTGALGRPVWVLVPRVPEWRYLRLGTSIPWYPSARLFRQDTLGDWGGVVAAVETELRRAASDSTRSAIA